MRLLGAKTVTDLGPHFVSAPLPSSGPPMPPSEDANRLCSQINSRAVERDIYDGPAGLDRSGLWTNVKAKI